MYPLLPRLDRRARRRQRLCAALALALAVGLPAGAMAQSPLPRAGVQAAEPSQASSGDEALDNAVAAVVVAALSDQLGLPAIEVRLDSFDVANAGPRDRSVSGQGRLRIGGEGGGWIGFRYRTLYDPLLRSAGYPELTIGGVAAGEHEVPNDARLVSELEDRVASGLASQSRGTPRLQLDRITTVEGGQRLLRITADGVADFGLDGTSTIEIVGLYDRVADRWQRVDYTLGTRPR